MATNEVAKYCKNTLKVWQMSDFMHKRENRPFTLMEWRYWVEKEEKEATGVVPTNRTIILRADAIYAVQKQVPRWIWKELKKKYEAKPKASMNVYLIQKNLVKPAIIVDQKWAQIVKIDSTGKPHRTIHRTQWRLWTVIQAHTWGGKWAGPKGANYALDTRWNCYKLEDLRQATISSLTTAATKLKFKPPASQEAWKERGIEVSWHKTWRMKPKYVAPRDLTVWLKIQHRNLWVAKSGGMGDTKCLARGCGDEESQLHLIMCSVIKRDFWKVIIREMNELELLPDRAADPGFGLTLQEWGSFLIAGQIENEPVNKEAAAFLCWAWRQLYAEVVSLRIADKRDLELGKAVWLTLRMAYSRVKAYGYKWLLWYARQRLWQEGKAKKMPEKHRTMALIEFGEEADYVISEKLIAAKERHREKEKRRREAAQNRVGAHRRA